MDLPKPSLESLKALMAARSAAANDQVVFPDPLEPPAPHSMPGSEEFGIEIPIPPDATPGVIRLRVRQRTVLELIMLGENIKSAAKRSNVSRNTVHRWMRVDKAFRGALDIWQERMQTSARGKIIAASDEAADVLVQRLRRGDLRAALAVLRLGGIAGANASLVQQVPASPPPASGPKGANRRRTLETRLRKLLKTLNELAQEPADADTAPNPQVLPAPTNTLPASAATMPETPAVVNVDSRGEAPNK